MIEARKRDTNLGVAVGLGLQIGGRVLLEQGSAVVGGLLLATGAAVFVWGCASYASGKGLSRWWGLLGLATFVGLIVLVLLPDRSGDAHRVAHGPVGPGHDPQWAAAPAPAPGHGPWPPPQP